MKKLYSTIIALLMATYTMAQWPANYGGVVLQGFYWDSYTDTSLPALIMQADDISTYFDVLWVPNTGNCGGKSMGYMPIYWLNHTSNWGRERYVRQLIDTYHEKGTKVIMDVVINHKAPLGKNGSWIDFVNEEKTVTTRSGEEKTYTLNWTGADICQNDDGGWVKEQGWEVTGADDTGDDFSGGRDLDHTGANVQQNVKTYLDYLRNYLGYDGFRLDMVKGYGAQFTKMYNEASKPEFCVGEYWDGSYQAVVDWINGTGKTSAAFDFPLKYVIRDAFGNGYWEALGNKGIAGSDYSRYAVTFIDNHDTYENQDRLTQNVLAAYAFILTMPGTPCVFYKHWQRYPIALGNMILARKACGITNQSPILEQGTQNGGYVIKVQGSKGTALCISGFVQGYDVSGYKLIGSGTNYAYYISDNVSVEGLREGSDVIDETKTVNVYVEAETAPYIYSWTEGGQTRSGEWPGTKMTETETIDGKTFWKWTFNVAPVNIILNDGNGAQTANITELTHDTYLTYSGGTDYGDETSKYWTPEVPVCVKVIDNHIYAYFLGNKDYDQPTAWVWNETKNFCENQTWPGDPMTLVGYDADNYPVYRWDGGEVGEGADMPTQILITNKGSETIRTGDLSFVNSGYYSAQGFITDAITVENSKTTGISEELRVKSDEFATAPVYNLAGQRVAQPTKGLYIVNGKKVIVK